MCIGAERRSCSRSACTLHVHTHLIATAPVRAFIAPNALWQEALGRTELRTGACELRLVCDDPACGLACGAGGEGRAGP